MKKTKKKISRIKRILRTPFRFIRAHAKFAGAFLREGRTGGMILEVILALQFCTWMMSLSIFTWPAWYSALLVGLIFVIVTELTALGARLLFGSSKRSRCYFVMSLSAVCANNFIGNQGNAALPALLMSFLLALSADVLGRCIFAFAKKKIFRQVFGYAAVVLCICYLALYGVFFRTDDFGSSRIDFYRNAAPAVAASSASGFDSYLQNGPYSVASLTYGPDEDADITTGIIDLSDLPTVQSDPATDFLNDLTCKYDISEIPVRGKIWYPQGQSGCPALFFVHGNHNSETPSYLGYEYLGEYLASNGYAVVSVDENAINALGTNNDSRAVLFLENMKTILAENEDGSSILAGIIDPDRLVIGGHSRGGEMAPTAYLFNDLDAHPDNGNFRFDYHFNISGIVAVAPVVDQYMPVGQPVAISDVNYLLLHGSNDQDVSTMMGEKQFNNVTFTPGSDGFHVKASVYILGANHGQFNSLWGRYDGEGAMNGFLNTCNFIDEADQKLIAKAYIRTFLDMTLLGDDTYSDLLRDNSPYLSALPDTVYITNYCDSSFESLCSFDGTVDLTSGYSEGTTVNCEGACAWTLARESYGSGIGENYVFSLAWEEGSIASVYFTFDPVDISCGCMSFCIADSREDNSDCPDGLFYTVSLTDINGNTVRAASPTYIYPTLAVQLYKQDVLFGSYEYKHQKQVVFVSSDDFNASEGFDFGAVTGMTISFGAGSAGNAILDEVGYYSSN